MTRITLVLIATLFSFYGCTSQPILSPEAKTLIKQAQAGNKQALHKVCYGYHRGKGMPQDYDQALKWCTQAAEKKIPSSQTLLAEIYYLGLGIDKDYKKAFHWYKTAANNNHVHAQYVLALMYLEGQGVNAKKSDKAIYWLQKATTQGHAKAQQKLKELKSKVIN